MTGAPSAAHAQCWGTLNAITSVIGTVNTAFLPSGSAFLASGPNGAPDQQSGGVWTRAVGGSVNTQTNTNFSGSFATPFGTVPIDASCRAGVKQDFIGFEAGHDIAVLNTGNSDWHFGALAGYVTAKAEVPTQGTNVSEQTGNFNVPSAGLYAAFSKGAFSADVQARLYELQAESLGQRLDARGYSLMGNVGYRIDLPGNWTLEPSAGAIFSRTSVDQLNLGLVTETLAGLVPTTLPVGPASLAAASGTMKVQDVDNVLGRASLKLGTTVPLAGGQVVAYPFVTASVFHEFEGNVTATVAANGTVSSTLYGTFPFQGAGTLTSSGIGTYGQFGGGSAFHLAETGWLGYARFDYRTGDNIQGYSVSGGLRYQFDDSGHGTANSARYPVKAAPSSEGYNWTGVYAGASAGTTWGRTHWATEAGTTDPDFAGYLFGGQAGYNYQTGRYVWGIEADAGSSNARGAAPCPSDPIHLNCEDDVGLLGSLTGRFGYTWGRALFYAKGGWAFGKVTAGTSLNFVDTGSGLAGRFAESTNWENGWTVGAGMEYALTDRWSAKAEYMHYGFPQYAFAVAPGTIANASAGGDIVRVGVNYHFGWPR